MPIPQHQASKKYKLEQKRVRDIYIEYPTSYAIKFIPTVQKSYRITYHNDTLVATPVNLKSTKGVYGTTLLKRMIIRS